MEDIELGLGKVVLVFVLLGLVIAFTFWQGRTYGGKLACVNTGEYNDAPLYLHQDFRCEQVPITRKSFDDPFDFKVELNNTGG